MITQEIKDFLDLQKLGYVATVSSDGKPNLSPKGTRGSSVTFRRRKKCA